MKQYLLTIIAVLAAIILALFSPDTANNPYSTRYYRTYSYNPATNAWSGTGNGMLSVLQEDNTGSVVAPLTEANPTAGSLSALPEAGSPLGAPPAMLATSAMMELTPVQLPPLDAGMVNVTGGFDGNSQTAGYRVNPRPGEFAIAVPYDPSLLPQGFTEDDIQTYVYDRQYHRWVAIQRDSVNEAELLVCSQFRPWEKGLPHTQNDLANPQDALAQVQDMMSFAPQGEGGGDSPLDFINAVLKTPEMPETSAYTPTSIKELKAADPLEELTLMQPPTANNSGTANLSYPIEIPAGRQGMQPNLALTYSSSGGNGWLGVGWDISIPSITVETRWGVPRYDQSKESEVYVYEGEQLVTKDGNGDFREMPHRTKNWTNRHDLDQDGYEQFFPRKNEAFDSIVRHGNGQDNYWWSVTHKNGVTDYYGKYEADSIVNNACVLRAGADNIHGAIAHWALAESVDPFGNSVRYRYKVEYHSGIAGSQNPGRQIYIDTIFYTAKGDDPGKYKIVFTRQQGREDITIAANRGFKEVTASTLCNIAVGYDNSFFKYYVFGTECGRHTNFKTRLSDVAVLHKTTDTLLSCMTIGDISKDSFALTHFDYYDYPNATGLFGDTVSLSLKEDDIKSTFVTSGSALAKATALGGTRGKSWNIGGTMTIGLGPVVPLTTASVGGNFNYSRSKSEGALTLIDLDGDGLADKVYKKRDGKLYYRKHIADSEHRFHYDSEEYELKDYSDPYHSESLHNFLSEVSSTTTWGLQLSLGLAYSGSWPTTKSTTAVYFADVNADGLPDLVTDGGVLFNVTERDGIVKFRNYYTISAESADMGNDSAFVHTTTDTCGGIIFTGEVSDSIVCQTAWVLDTTFFFRHTILPENEALYAHWFHYADSLEKTGEYRCLYSYYDQKEYLGAVSRIDIYKKVIVSCDPFPTSTSASDILERDPDLEAVKVWVAKFPGQIDIVSKIRQRQDSTASFLQSKTRDGMSYAIQHSKNVSATEDHKLSVSTSANTEILANGQIGENDDTLHYDSVRVTVLPGDLIFFRLISGENHDYDNVEWDQTIRYAGLPLEYNAARDFVLSGDKHFGAGASGNSNKIGMSVKISTGNLGSSFNDMLIVAIVDTNGNILPGKKKTLILQSGWTDHLWYPFGSPSPNTTIYQSQQVKCMLSSPNSAFPWESVRVTPHISYLVWNDDHYDTVESYPQVDMLIDNYDGSVKDSVYHRLFGPLYKGWGQFAYNNNDTVNGQVVHDSYIHLEKLVTDWNADVTDNKEARKMRRRMRNFHMQDQDSTTVRESSTMVGLYDADTLYNPLSLKTSWVEMQPDFQHYAWVGYGNVNHITDSMMSNTRMPNYHSSDSTSDIEEYDHPVPIVAQGLDVKTVRKQNYSKMKNHSLSLSAPLVPFSVGTSVSEGYNLILTDYMDLNGDRYPDILGPSQVQYTQPWGGIGDVTTMGIFENGITKSNTKSGGMNFGGSFEMPSRGASNNPKNSKISFDGAGNAGASHGGGSDETAMTWMDMNSDGLPDKVVCKNGALEVYLNRGYGFLDKDIYASPYVRKGKSDNTGLNFGGSFNIGQASIGGGIGVNFSKNLTGKMLMDFNADGLPDMVERDTTGGQDRLKVRYAKGNGSWSDWDFFPNLTDISFGRSFSESADASVTVGFTFMSIVKLCVGISGSPYSRTFSKDSVQLTDINGDGYADYVTSQSEGRMTVRYNQAAKTNLLRKVTNFTGSYFEMDYDMPLACYDKAQRSWNLASVETHNNVAACPVGGNSTLTTFEYESPNYNRYERMDYGYERVTTYQHDPENNGDVYRYTVEEFNNRDFNKRGRKTRDCLYDEYDNPYVEHIYGDTLYDFAGSEVSDGGCARTDVYVGREADITNWYEGYPTPQLTSVTQREYDRYRNVIKYTHRGDTTHFDEWFTAEIDYARNMSHNLTALPVQIVVKDRSGNIKQKRTATYYSTGKLEQRVLHNNPGNNAQFDFTYDGYGNLSGTTQPENINGQRLSFSYQYDNQVHTYPARVDNNSLGFYSTAEYNLKFGKPTKTTDINGNEMWYEYDNLGRMVRITAPYEQDIHAPYTIKMEYHPHNYSSGIFRYNSNSPYSYATTCHFDIQHPNNPIRTTLISDGLGRLLQTKKDAEIGGQEVSLVTGKVEYDCFGRTVKQYHPFTEDTVQYASYNDSVTIGTATETKYDILDRQTRVKLPTHEVTRMEYGFGNIGGKTVFSATTTDALNNSVQVLKGTLGQQLKQVAPYGTTTLFEYDCLGQLKRSTDPDGFETFYDYDMFGQMIHRKHPDAGNDNYVYDPAGNLIRHTNEMGESLDYKYYFNQLTDITCSHYPEYNVHYKYGTSADAGINAVGKVILQEDASGWQTFAYGKLEEVTGNIRTFTLPYEQQPYTFDMRFVYDSWNRIDTMVYPDGEIVCYGYNSGGMLNSITGSKNGLPYKYLDSVRYNEFELKSAMYYGNGTKTFYKYDILQRLDNLQSYTAATTTSPSEIMQDIYYKYDSVSNIIDISNYAGTLLNGLGGKYGNTYKYNNLYRLEYSEGAWYGNHPAGYKLNMEYTPNGRIVKKHLDADTYTQTPFSSNQSPVLYQNDYHYTNNNQPNTLTYIDNSPHQDFKWDVKGNLIFHYNGNVPFKRFLCWDEQNRLLGVKDDKFLSYYQYDANGDRIYKLTGEFARQNRNGEWRYYYYLKRPTLYASPYLVTNPKGYTKHYYAESERIASRMGGGGLYDIDRNDNPEMFVTHKERSIKLFAEVMECLETQAEVPESLLKFLYEWKDIREEEKECYWYHPDHLGSSSWITFSDGKAVEHLHYMPWGEDFVRQRSTDWHAMYTFSAKEKDTETGYSYFGARYYSSDLSIWLSVDPMSDSIPHMTPYNYCKNSPTVMKDPNGEFPIETIWDIANVVYDVGAAVVNHAKGNHAKAKKHWVDAAFDAAAMAIPYVPAGASKATKAANVTGKAIGATKVVEKVEKKSFGDILSRTKFLSKSKVAQYEAKGDYKTASKWFDEMDLDKVETFQTQYGDAKRGVAKDGSTIILRRGSGEGSPTIERQVNGTPKQKIRFHND